MTAALVLTLVIDYYAYAWTCDASATAYNLTNNYTYANGAAYVVGYHVNFAKVRIKNTRTTRANGRKSATNRGQLKAPLRCICPDFSLRALWLRFTPQPEALQTVVR